MTDRSATINILMTGGGAPGAAGILHCLKQCPQFNIWTADASIEAVTRHLHDQFALIPLATDTDYVPQLLSFCREKNIHVVMPLVTRELPILAGAADLFKSQGTEVLVSPLNALELSNDKGNLYRAMEMQGLPLPAFRIVHTPQEFDEAVKQLQYPSQPVCFKPCQGNGSRGFRILDASVDESDWLFKQKPSGIYITLAEARRILQLKAFPPLLVAEFLPGEEYSVDCLADNGETILAIPRLRSKMINGISVSGTFVHDEEIINYCKDIIRILGLHGNIGIQLRRSASGQPLLLEVNPRVQGTIVAALGAGVNLPVLAVKQALGWPINAGETQVKWGTHFLRYWQEVFY
jgi:carbamoyl-phosphate synthase large subunit